MRTSITSSLRFQLLLLVFLAAVPAFALIIYDAQLQKHSASEDAKREALTLARNAVRTQEVLIADAQRSLGRIAQRPEVDVNNPTGCSALLASELKNNDRYTNLGATDLEGNVLCSARPQNTLINIADRIYFQKTVKKRDFSVGNFQFGRLTGKASVGLGYPNFDSKGRLQGIVYAILDLQWLNDFIAKNRLSFGPNVVLNVIDQNGVVLARSIDPKNWVGKAMPNHPVFEAMLAHGNEGTVEGGGMDGINRLYAFAPLRFAGQISGYVAVGIPTDLAFADVKQTIFNRLILMTLVIGFIGLIAWIGSDVFFLRQVTALLRATKRIAAGELHARTGVAVSSGELSRLAQSFDEMAAIIEQNNSQHQQYEETLRKRTAEIQVLHDIGHAIIALPDIKPVSELILEKTLSVIGGDIGVIRLMNSESQRLEHAVSQGYRTAQDIRSLAVDSTDASFSTLQAEVFRDRRAHAVENIQDVKGLRTFKKEGVSSAVAVPVIVGDEVLGTIQIGSRAPKHFAPETINLLESIGNQLGIAVQKFRSIELTERAYNETQALYSLTSIASQSLNLDEILNQIVRKVSELFEFDLTRIYLTDPASEDIVLRAACDHLPQSPTSTGPLRRRHGIGSAVINSGNPLIFSDILNDPTYAALTQTGNLKTCGVRFFAALPIKGQNGPLGVFTICHRKPRALTNNEMALFGALSEQLGIAVQNALLYEQSIARSREISALFSIAAIAAESLDISIILRKIMHKVLELFSFDAARICLRDGHDSLMLTASEGFSNGILTQSRFQIGRGLVGKAFESGEPILIENMETDPRYDNMSRGGVMLKRGFRSCFFIPIKVRGDTLGVMNFLNKAPRTFSQADLQLIKAIAYHLGVALGNAQLFSQVTQKSAELEKSNSAKDEFLSVTSHELRTPLNVIMGYSALLLDGTFGGLNREQNNALDTIKNQSRDLLTMVESILNVTKIETGKLSFESADFSLADFLDQLKSAYALSCGDRCVLQWNYPPRLPIVKTDSYKLKHICQNLINNAIKFTEKGAVSFSAGLVAGSSALKCKVADTGPGIPDDLIPHIFEMFRQADGSQTRSYGGLGLGLYIVKKYTECLGGTIEVTSQLGKGTTFTVTIPITMNLDVDHPEVNEEVGQWF